MSIKEKLLRLYNWGFLSHEKTDRNQQAIRETEWRAISPNIPEHSKFIDVGCGAGYSMIRATKERNCECFGIDPCPGQHGVGRYGELNKSLNITQGVAENIPFEDKKFDIVYSSHVLEHVDSEGQSLLEMQRVLKDDGVLIIGLPTATMAWINCFSQLIFTTHQRIFNVMFKYVPGITTGNTFFINMLIPCSHSEGRAKTIFYDLKHYKIKNWKKTISSHFNIEKIILPALYPYPEYRQLFRMKHYRKFSSSVFFICKKKQ